MAAKRKPARMSLATKILVEIRDETRKTNARLDQTREELRGELRETNARLAALDRRQTESEVRLATEVVAVAKAVGDVRDLLREGLALRPRLDDHESRLVALERKVG